MRKGTVVAPDETAIAIHKAANEAERMSGCKVKNVVVGIAGMSIHSQLSHGIIKACNLAGLKEVHFVLQSQATAETLLLPEERKKDVALIDFGGGPAKLAIFSKGTLCSYDHLIMVGTQLTADVAVGLRIPVIQAKQLKRQHGCSLPSIVNGDEMIEIDSLKSNGKQLMARKHIVDIIEMRLEEVFMLIAQKLHRTNQSGDPLAGAVITGGGALLPGIELLAQRVLDMPVRNASPRSVNGLVDTISQPQHATAVGLVLLGARK
jgi:cell division protein FtsA